jgi:hypothetical protein
LVVLNDATLEEDGQKRERERERRERAREGVEKLQTASSQRHSRHRLSETGGIIMTGYVYLYVNWRVSTEK